MSSSLSAPRFQLLLATLRLSAIIVMVPEASSYGLQSGPAVDSTFAGGMVYDSVTSKVYLSGLTYDASGWLAGAGSNGGSTTTQAHCFISEVSMNDWNWSIGTILAPTSMCSAVALLDQSLDGITETLFVAGNSEAGGFGYDDSSGSTNNGQAVMMAFGTLVKRTPSDDTLVTTSVMRVSSANRIEYPQFILSQARNIYSIGLVTMDSQDNRGSTSSSSPNLLQHLPYGRAFDMTVRKLALENNEFLGIPSGSTRLVVQWVKDFPAVAESSSTSTDSPPSVYLGGGLIMPDDQHLLMVGSTRGRGSAYGDAEGDDEDGFLTLLDLAAGNVIQSVRIGTDKPDVIMGVCADPLNSESVYVVGATQGTIGHTLENDSDLKPPQGSLSGFVSKISIDGLKAEWSRQWGARIPENDGLTGTFAVGCSVRDDLLYVAGGVENGAGIIQGQNILASNGKDDIWAAALDIVTGDQQWIQQVGTDGQDRLSRHGGVIVDVFGTLMLYGDTTGSFFRTKTEDTTDVFLMVFARDGGYSNPVGSPVTPPTPQPVPVTDPPMALPTSVPSPFSPKADQLSEAIFVGAMIFDSKHNQAIITGQAILGSSSACFLSYFDMVTGTLSSPIHQSTQACSSIAYSPLEDFVYLGSTDLAATSKFQSTGNRNADVFGILMQLVPSTEFPAFALLQDSISQYPVKVITHPTQDVIFVAMEASDDGDASGNVNIGSTQNIINGRPYGSNFYISIERYALTPENEAGGLTLDWEIQWRVDQPSERVYTSGMTLAGNTLIVVGSTRGTSVNGPFGEENSGGDMDGFILKMDPITGALVGTNGHRSSTRLDSINHMDDWVLGVCSDVFDESSVYLVGKTKGKVRDLSDDEQPPEGTIHAYVAKVKVETLTAEWLKHFTMQANVDVALAAAYGCAVTKDNLVYVAGVIEDGATMDDATVSPGAANDDLFVAQLDGRSGQVNWIRQVGSDQSEQLAQRGGISVDNDGNAIVYAETSGSMFAEWSGDTEDHKEAVVFTMSKSDGSYADLHVPGSPPVAAPVSDPSTTTDDTLPDSITAVQTGPDVGPTYAGGMFYSPFTDSLYLTGATYGSFSASGVEGTAGSSCFLGVMSLPKLEWRERDVYGTSTAPEACSAVSLTSIDTTTTAVVVGSTEDGGLLTNLGSSGAKQYGMVLDLASIDGQFELQGGALIDREQVQYPITVETFDSSVWVVSMTARDATVNPDVDKTSTSDHPNLTAGGIHKYGSKYRIAIDKYEMQRPEPANADGVLENSMQLKWHKPFETADQEAVYVSDLITVQDGSVLVVVGSTKGSKNSPNMDGIMAKIDPKDGTFVSVLSGDRAVAYFSSITDRDDWLFGACTDPDDSQAFYVVGATQGKMDSSADRARRDVTVHAVVAKIHVGKLTAIWTKQFSVTHASGSDEEGAAASAFGCEVITGAGAIYIAGTVENGAVMDQGDQKSAGRDDIFVAKLLTKDGNLVWMKQVGSNGDDRVAYGGGVKVDANGNAVVYGDTNGSFFRDRSSDGATEDYSDLFVMIFNQADGSHVDPIQAGPTKELPSDTSTPEEWYPNGVSRDKSTLKLASFAIVALGTLVIGCLCLWFGRRQARKRAEMRKASVFMYLQQFDVEDVDLRKSPPGGWHGTYLHKLAYGINKADTRGELQNIDIASNTTYETAALTHSSLVRDSLFMDKTSTPSLGAYRDDPETLGYYGEQSNRLTMKEVI